MDNEPWSQDLLDWLAYDFVQNGYDIKKLIYTITTSKTYQLPSEGIKDAGLITAPTYVFKGMVRRRLTAEQFARCGEFGVQSYLSGYVAGEDVTSGHSKRDSVFAGRRW